MTKKVFDGLGGDSKCEGRCSDGWTTNGNKDNICQKCDPSCETCEDDGDAGDRKKCKSCAPATPYLFSKLSECTKECGPGRYQIQGGSTEKRCYECDPLCADCFGNQRNCTRCDPEHKPEGFKYLQTLRNEEEGEKYARGTCVGVCVIGYFHDVLNPQNKKCGKCEPPCTACQKAADYCLACDGSPSA